jgi:hypothetical protein
MQEQRGMKEKETDREFTVELSKTLIMIIQRTKCSLLSLSCYSFRRQRAHVYNPILFLESTGDFSVYENNQEISAFL